MKHNDYQHQDPDNICHLCQQPASLFSKANWSVMPTAKVSLFYFCLFVTFANGTYARCATYNTLIKCSNTMISDEEVAKQISANDLHVQNFNGQLTTEGIPESEISSIQFQESTITHIQPRFFYRFTNGNLKVLSLTRIGGKFHLNSDTLGGLESVLVRLLVNDHQLQDMGDISNLEKLEVLKLVRTGLKKLPTGFEKLVTHLNDLDVSDNKLTALPWAALAKRIEYEDFRGLRVGNNPWHCDCQLKPILTAARMIKKKVTGLKCASPPELIGQTLDTLKLEDICTVPEERDVKPPENPQPEDITKAPSKDNLTPYGGKEYTYDDNSDVSAAGATALSAEVIVVIVAVCVIVLIIVSAVVAYKVRQRNERRRNRTKTISHKSNSYCAVIENPEDGRAAQSGKRSSNTRVNHENSEHQPLSGQGYNRNYRDPRL